MLGMLARGTVSVGDSFLPFEFHRLAQTSCLEVVQLFGMSAEETETSQA